MRVLLSAFSCDPSRGSEPGNGWAWAKALTEIGHDVHLLTSSRARDAIADSLADLGGQISVSWIDSARKYRALGPKSEMYAEYLTWQGEALRFTREHRVKADVSHHVTWGSLRLGSRLYELPWPLIYGPVGGAQRPPTLSKPLFGTQWHEERVRGMLAGPLLKTFPPARKTMQRARLVLAQNTATARAAETLGAREVDLMLADGLPESWLVAPREQPNSRPMILWVGRMFAHKAPELALYAFSFLRETVDARLVFVGDGPWMGRLLGEAERLGLGNDVDFVGNIPHDHVVAYYDMASLLLFTSMRDSFGAQVLEALGRGLPVCAFDHQGIADMAPDFAVTKQTTSVESIEALARGLAGGASEVLTDGRWQQRSSAAVKWAACQTWPRKAEAMSRRYEMVCNHR